MHSAVPRIVLTCGGTRARHSPRTRDASLSLFKLGTESGEVWRDGEMIRSHACGLVNHYLTFERVKRVVVETPTLESGRCALGAGPVFFSSPHLSPLCVPRGLAVARRGGARLPPTVRIVRYRLCQDGGDGSRRLRRGPRGGEVRRACAPRGRSGSAICSLTSHSQSLVALPESLRPHTTKDSRVHGSKTRPNAQREHKPQLDTAARCRTHICSTDPSRTRFLIVFCSYNYIGREILY